jgi:hypothetical protein
MKRIWFILGIALAALPGAAAAAVIPIVHDTFTNPDPASGNFLTNRTPEDVNVPGDVWRKVGAGNTPDGTLFTDGSRLVARTPFQSRTFLDGINVSNTLIVSASLRYDGAAQSPPGQPDSPSRNGAGVGFFSTNTALEPAGYFAGIALGPASANDSTVSLKLINNHNTPSNFDAFNNFEMLVAQLPYVGTLTGATDYHDLEYIVDSASGELLRVILDGDTYDFGTNVTFFTGAHTANFGFYSTGNFGYFDFVQLAVPEPSSVALLGMAGLLFARWRR